MVHEGPGDGHGGPHLKPTKAPLVAHMNYVDTHTEAMEKFFMGPMWRDEWDPKCHPITKPYGAAWPLAGQETI